MSLSTQGMEMTPRTNISRMRRPIQVCVGVFKGRLARLQNMGTRHIGFIISRGSKCWRHHSKFLRGQQAAAFMPKGYMGITASKCGNLRHALPPALAAPKFTHVTRVKTDGTHKTYKECIQYTIYTKKSTCG